MTTTNQINGNPTRTLFFSTSEASIYSPEANQIINFADCFYRKIQSYLTMDELPSESTFEIGNSDEYVNLSEYVVGHILHMADEDGIRVKAYWGDASDGEESVIIWFYDQDRKPAKMLKLVCTDERYLKEAAEIMAEQSEFEMLNIL